MSRVSLSMKSCNLHMRKWKVFEIAAALPLLLQLALFPFFVGLCFFTAQIDSAMGLTSVPLVAAWIFLLVLTTMGPLVSSRCPYKLLLLKRASKWARQWIRPATFYLVKRLAALGHAMLALQHWALYQTISHYTALTLTLFHYMSLPKGSDADEEDIVVKSSQEDTDILLLTDAMVLDDGLLSLMLDAVQQSQDKPDTLIAFIISSFF